jgi:hypothetical protein
MHTKDILASALRDAGLPLMAIKAAEGYYHDYLSPLPIPEKTLCEELTNVGTPAALALCKRVRPALSANAGDGTRHGARVTRRPATGIDLGQEIADDVVEQVRRFEIDGVPAIRHHRESRRWDGALHQQRRRQAGPVLVAGEDQRRHLEAGHLVLQMIQRRTLLLAAELGVDGTQG